jgi:hypothetical protein
VADVGSDAGSLLAEGTVGPEPVVNGLMLRFTLYALL